MKPQRHAAILELVRDRRVSSQEVLRDFLAERGFEVAQATLSRDIRELGLVKVPDENGGSTYTLPPGVTDPTPDPRPSPPLALPGIGRRGEPLVVKTMVGGAQPIAVGIDWEEWPEVLGTVAGDDTILVILRGRRAPRHHRTPHREIAGV
jgi:transcriptional regulator of arginine metabolism